MKERLFAYWSAIRTKVSIWRLFVVAFIFIMVFIDNNSLIQRYEYNKKIKELQKEIKHYNQIIEEGRLQLEELRSNDDNLEKFAREKFLMKKPNEDIFLIE
ncbi:MAG TPA: septum formation initiator family protein [Candidatus Gallibacteroides avistercoris]|uniref:Septum formation initiator family protein n=1 Tax=Candidatus Gallibacteroides avistercoris TaxID=2840833 RepID=A0A9D1M8Z2_9BACT|nr:septum formation initiator family protein [Candidatus Gallibacteroides avistercoris]